MNPTPIRKAVFPVAGLGTRFLPATKANPKEMLPIVDRPLIQYAVEEAIAAGIRELIFVTNSGKRSIEDYFDTNYELENKLAQQGRQDLLDIVHNILPDGVSCAYVRQATPLGLGHAVLCAKNLVGNEPFAVLLADDLIVDGTQGCLKHMISRYMDQTHRSSMLAVESIPRTETRKYGIVDIHKENQASGKISAIVEKPAPEKAPSNLAVVGRYILTPTIFNLLEKTPVDSRGEIQLTDAISQLLLQEDVYSYRLQGTRFDCGSKLGYLQATVHYALRHPELADGFRMYLEHALAKEQAMVK